MITISKEKFRKSILTMPNLRDTPVGWRLRRINKLSGELNFGCDECPAKKPNRCCWSCCEMLGHLRYLLTDINYYVERWDSSTGFWREGKGCTLDRACRSFVCTSFVCSAMTEKVDKSVTMYKEMVEEVYVIVLDLLSWAEHVGCPYGAIKL